MLFTTESIKEKDWKAHTNIDLARLFLLLLSVAIWEEWEAS
jgi:hypothetical protein